MIIFEQITNNSEKINFVDKYNAVVGFDIRQQCCENFGWFICDRIDQKELTEDLKNQNIEDLNKDLSDYNFDPDFFRQSVLKNPNKPLYDQKTEDCVLFRLMPSSGGKYKYLYLYNHHNGYYSHGFEMRIDNRITHSGNL